MSDPFKGPFTTKLGMFCKIEVPVAHGNVTKKPHEAENIWRDGLKSLTVQVLYILMELGN